MTKILKLDSIQDYLHFLGIETLHSLISVIDFSTVKPLRHIRKNYGFYAVFLKDVDCGNLQYGRNYYDYQEGTLVFVSPGQIVGNDDTGEEYQFQGWALLFHPDLLRGTSLATRMKEYTFFSYEANESLHMSERERHIILNCLKEIKEELEHSIDKHSRSIITANIEVFLNHCMRFYDRQFVTREYVNKDTLSSFEQLLNSYFETSKPETIGLPSVQYFAEQLHLSPNYFGDLIKKETGKTAQEYIQLKLIEKSKQKLSDSTKTVNEVAYELGFKYPHHFSRLFKKVAGCSPTDFRSQN
ncbi:helix-turn-helix domain-containing protein [Proteiniphilum acetatigenes]|uniref:helix-turn-helix domain-containing protein n=1 Tax=Proteiniphilum acetatigenes TaxID=294710 RepID=UPI000377DC1E|nr:helix-turn-helix domain-containing protein [Proteiniphilum acetatigenes]SFL47063.1 Helix-turn-helix domain-containing protein [Porphyromonadaceae bacterium KH3CP3RA]